MLLDIIIKSLIAGLLASLACGLGALPLRLQFIDPKRHAGIAYAFAGGLMFSAAVYNLILPGLTHGHHTFNFLTTAQAILGILLGSLVIWATDRRMRKSSPQSHDWSHFGGRPGMLILLTMAIHSIPEGVAVGVGFASDAVFNDELGVYIAVAIAIHNIPEGLAVAIPMRAAGASNSRCFLAATLSSLPQPIAAVPAGALSWLVTPIMPTLMGFAAGAMIFLVVLELIPDALSTTPPATTAWSFTIGFVAMLLIQTAL
jgi:ZIP family zinc transporter